MLDQWEQPTLSIQYKSAHEAQLGKAHGWRLGLGNHNHLPHPQAAAVPGGGRAPQAQARLWRRGTRRGCGHGGLGGEPRLLGARGRDLRGPLRRSGAVAHGARPPARRLGRGCLRRAAPRPRRLGRGCLLRAAPGGSGAAAMAPAGAGVGTAPARASLGGSGEGPRRALVKRGGLRRLGTAAGQAGHSQRRRAAPVAVRELAAPTRSRG